MKLCCICKDYKETINFCKNKSSKDGLAYQCKDCAKTYRDNNKEKKKKYNSSSIEYRKQYLKSNKDHINSLRRLKRVNTFDKCKAQSAKSHLKNRNERLAKQRQYYQNNKEYFKIKSKKYRDENVDSILLRNRQRKALISRFTITQEQVNKLLLDYNNKCFYCNCDVKRGINLHLDHKVPLSRGGDHNIENLIPACSKCNLQKGTKTIEEFMMKTINEADK